MPAAEEPVTGTAERAARARRDRVRSGWNSGWDDGPVRGDGLMGSESNPELDGQPPEDSEGRLHISVVLNQITQGTGCGKEWKGKPADEYSSPERLPRPHTTREKPILCNGVAFRLDFFFLSLWSELT